MDPAVQAAIQQSAQECLTAWAAAEETASAHAACSVLELSAGGSFKSSLGTYTLPATAPTLQVRSVNVLGVGSKSAAAVHVGAAEWQGWMVLLLTGDLWTCISAAFSMKVKAILPQDLEAVTRLVWDGYCAANRACNGEAMAKVFHETCSLTYAFAGVAQIKDCPTFCHMVAVRYEEDERHIPYAYLQNDPRVVAGDSLLAVEFATPDLAMVTLKVGHPPFLWTDLLTCAKLNGQWWIVHKSSCSEPFLVDLKQAEAT